MAITKKVVKHGHHKHELGPGQSWSWKQKIDIQASRVGLDMRGQQPANATIFDTQILTTSPSAPQVLSFFGPGNSTNLYLSNWQKGTYYAGETLLCTHVWFQAFQLSGTGITNSNITYTSNPDILPNAVSGLGNSVMSLVIGNQTVLKNYLTHELYPQFNPAGTGIAATFDVTATPGTTYVTGASKIRLEANPLIYPNITVACNLLVPPITVSGTWAVMCIIGRQGTIYSAGGPMGA